MSSVSQGSLSFLCMMSGVLGPFQVYLSLLRSCACAASGESVSVWPVIWSRSRVCTTAMLTSLPSTDHSLCMPYRDPHRLLRLHPCEGWGHGLLTAPTSPAGDRAGLRARLSLSRLNDDHMTSKLILLGAHLGGAGGRQKLLQSLPSFCGIGLQVWRPRPSR